MFRAGSKSRDFVLVNKTIFSKSENFRSIIQRIKSGINFF